MLTATHQLMLPNLQFQTVSRVKLFSKHASANGRHGLTYLNPRTAKAVFFTYILAAFDGRYPNNPYYYNYRYIHRYLR
jgi:hypothetical protein